MPKCTPLPTALHLLPLAPVNKKHSHNTACPSFILNAFVGSACACYKLRYLSVFLTALVPMILWRGGGCFMRVASPFRALYLFIFCTELLSLTSDPIARDSCPSPFLLLSGKSVKKTVLEVLKCQSIYKYR